MKFAGGVVMAGDRRATEGYSIASRRIDKVSQCDHWSAMAIAGAAGPGMEMVRLLQTELEHYEKVEGEPLSLEGKANKLSQMIRANLPAAMQGLVVVPLFCGYDLRKGEGRLYKYDVTGGKYEEADYATTGSGSVHARNWIKAGFKPDMTAEEAVEPRPAGPVPGGRRGLRHRRARPGPAHLPDGGRRRPQRLREAGRRRRRAALDRAAPVREVGAVSMPFYVSPEQVMKDRADYARKGIARGRSLVALQYSDGIALVAENPSGTLHKISEIYDRIAFAGVGKYNEFEMLKIAGIRHADVRGYQYSREDVTARALANGYAQTLGQVFTHEMKPYEVEILVAQVGEQDGESNEMFHILYDGTVMDEHGFTVLGGQAEAITDALKADYTEGLDMGGCHPPRHARRSARPTAGTSTADQLEVAVLDRNRPRRKFLRIEDDEVAQLLAG